ncbi:hypothetical protein AAG570_002623 [Ranatra chinensis]|uniref:Odorant receptor n=1 Tax=Ranatra chinensis TaxID=642074 RepID=A0ABD0Y8H0_9HEMI
MFKCHLRDVLLSLFLRGKVEKYKRVKKAAREGVVETTKYKGGFLRDFDKRIVRRPGVRRPRRKYGPLRRIYMRVSTPGTYWNFVAKSFFGFICGVVLTYCTYLFFMLQLGLELEKAFFICSVFGLLTTLFLAFSSSARKRCSNGEELKETVEAPRLKKHIEVDGDYVGKLTHLLENTLVIFQRYKRSCNWLRLFAVITVGIISLAILESPPEMNHDCIELCEWRYDPFLCFYMMLLPSVFSRSGRNAVTAYAIILVLTGPARNVLFNVQILTEALICAEDQLSSVMQKVVDMVKSPIYAIRDAVKHVANKMKEVTAKFSQILQSIQRMVTSLAGSLKLGLEWLNDCVTVCSHTVGTPYTRCQNSFKRATADCKEHIRASLNNDVKSAIAQTGHLINFGGTMALASVQGYMNKIIGETIDIEKIRVKLGPMFNWMCSVGHLTKVTCYTVKLMDLMCDMVEYVTDDNVEIVLNKFEELARRVKNMFYVDVVFNHTYNYKMQFSKTVKEMSAGVVYGIRKKLSFFYSLFDLLSLSLLIFMLLIIIS